MGRLTEMPFHLIISVSITSVINIETLTHSAARDGRYRGLSVREYELAP